MIGPKDLSTTVGSVASSGSLDNQTPESNSGGLPSWLTGGISVLGQLGGIYKDVFGNSTNSTVVQQPTSNGGVVYVPQNTNSSTTPGTPAATSNNTMLYIGIGVALLVIIIVTILMLRK